MKGSLNTAKASTLSSTWLRITGKDKWTPTVATVFSYAFTQGYRQVGAVGYHVVVYSYSVEGARYSGNFSDYGRQDDEYLKPNDTFPIKYNPRHPSRSYYPDLRTRRQAAVINFAIGFALGALVLAIKLCGRAAHS